jgi:hypothetical protein
METTPITKNINQSALRALVAWSVITDKRLVVRNAEVDPNIQGEGVNKICALLELSGRLKILA